MNLRKIYMILVFMILQYNYLIEAFSIADDVEIFNGIHPESSWAISNPDPVNRDSNHGTTIPFADKTIKTIRNRRDLKYHIKSVPKADILFGDEVINAPIFEEIPRHFIKRDIEHISDMDVSAQYTEQLAIDRVNPKAKREVIEEENAKNTGSEKIWIPQPLDDDDFFEIKTEEKKPDNKTERIPVAEALTEKQTGRGARGLSKDQWVKLPFLPPRLENDQLTAVSPINDDVNHRVPRVNFVTQGKGLQTAESRNQRESIPKTSSSRLSDLRTDIYSPKDNRARSLDYSAYSRRSYGRTPDDYYRRSYYDDYYDDYNYNPRRYPSNYDRYDYDRVDYKNSRNFDYNDYGRSRDPYDRYDSYDDGYYRSGKSDRPRRIIYYANLPDVVRTPPNVYRYPYSRYDDDRNSYGRGNYYPSSRYPYSALKKAEDPRDLSVSSTAINKEKSEAQKRQDELLRKAKADSNGRGRDAPLVSHSYPINNNLGSSLNGNDNNVKGQHQTLYHDITRMDSDLHRYEHPSFQTVIDDPYLNRRD